MTFSRRAMWAAVAISGFGLCLPRAEGAVTFFYDPETGNVSFDTAGSPTGRVGSYEFHIWPGRTDIRFRSDNHVRVSNSPFYFSQPTLLGDDSDFNALIGLYTIGDILPTGLDEATWTTLFDHSLEANPETVIGTYYYSDVLAPEGAFMYGDAEFVYGAPDRPFDNRLDLLDPDEIQWASTAVLRYQPWDGVLVLDTSGADSGYISSFGVDSEDSFLSEAFTPPTDSPIVEQNSSSLYQFSEILEPGVYPLGSVLEPGLSLGEFQELITGARFLTRAGYGYGSFNFEADGHDFALVYAAVPEPTALLLIGLAVFLFAQQRRATQRGQ